MRNMSFVWLFMIFSVANALEAPLFHFDFGAVDGKRSLSDRSGRFECRSARPMRGERGALRIAPTAEIVIPTEKLPDLRETLTVSAWILKRSTPDVVPILSRGGHPAFQFLFGVAWRYPILSAKSPAAPYRWLGIHYSGSFGSNIFWPDHTWQRPGAPLVERSGRWHQITGVYDRGAVSLYIDGTLVARKNAAKGERLPDVGGPLFVGAERLRGEVQNFNTADMLLNDLRLYDLALDTAAVAGLYRSDRSRYPEGDLIPRGESHLNALAPCAAYLDPDFDPAFQRKLKLTAEYEKNLPAPFAAGTSAVARIQGGSGAPRLIINGENSFPIQFAPVYMYADGKPRFSEAASALRDFAAAGIEKCGISIANDPRTGRFWLGEKRYDWSVVDHKFRDAIRANPRAMILVHFFIQPPEWFLQSHPDEIEQCYFGKQLRPFTMAGLLNSELWLKTSVQMFRDLVEHIEKSDYANHIYGYLPGGGNSGEWYWPGSVISGVPGYSKATAAGFRAYLRNRYRTDAALRQSWNDPAVTLAAAAVPSPEMRRKSETLLFRDPQAAMAVIDFRRYMTETTFRHIEATTRAIKDACAGRKLVGVYSGYPLDMIAPKFFYGGLQNTGRVFRLKSVDFLATPIDYRSRRGGEPGLCVNPFNGSSFLHGKLLEHENDIRTHFHYKIESGRTATLAETVSVAKRGFGNALTRGAGFWYYLFDNAWFHQETIMETVRDLGRAADRVRNNPRESAAETAVVFDEHSCYLLGLSGSGFLRGHTAKFYQESSRAGAPFDFYLLDDFADGGMKRYKLYIFLNAYSITPAQRASILGKLERDRAVAVWCYAPGAFDGERFNLDGMHKLTGMKFASIPGPETLRLNQIDRNHPLGQSLTGAEAAHSVGPIFYPEESGVRVLARAGRYPALAVKDNGKFRSIYTMMPITRALLTALCDYANAHVYLRTSDVFNADRDFAMLHTSTAGVKTIALPTRCDVYDLLANRKLFENVSSFTETLPAGETRIYQFKKH